MNKPTITIIGASGFVGGHLYADLKENFGNKYSVKGTFGKNQLFESLEYLDVTDKHSIENFILTYRPKYILWVVGLKDVKKCEDDFELAFAINTQPIKDLISIIKKNELNSKVIYFSSDYVFDGERGYYKDSDIPNPRTNYGKTKLSAENLLIHSAIDFKIVRTAAVMGKRGVFFDWIMSELNNGQEIKLFNNIFFSPTPIKLLNEMTLKLLLDYEKVSSKIIHIIGEKRLSRYEYGILLSHFIGNKKTKIIPETFDLSTSTFQKDLSLIQSNFVKTNQQKTFEKYLEKYIKESVLND